MNIFNNFLKLQSSWILKNNMNTEVGVGGYMIRMSYVPFCINKLKKNKIGVAIILYILPVHSLPQGLHRMATQQHNKKKICYYYDGKKNISLCIWVNKIILSFKGKNCLYEFLFYRSTSHRSLGKTKEAKIKFQVFFGKTNY